MTMQRRASPYDMKEWRRTDVHTISIMAQDRSPEWRRVVIEALDTNGRKPMEWRRRNEGEW